MVTGNPDYGSPTAAKTEAFDLSASTTCQSLPDFPVEVTLAAGAFVNNRVAICGSGGGSIIAPCYTLAQNENTWTRIGNLQLPRFGAASVAIGNKLVFFGGLDSSTKMFLQSTEELDVETGTTTPGPNMPDSFAFHCAVKLDATRVLIIGGIGDIMSYDSQSTFFYDVVAKSFTPGPNLNQRRQHHACALLNTGAESFIVVAGGLWAGSCLDSTEYMNVNQPTMWMTGL